MIKFGTDGWRSLMSEDFNVENVKKVAQAIAEYLLQSANSANGIIIGYDTRHNSKIFAYACAGVMIANGVKTYLPGRPLPTPLTAFSIVNYKLGGAIMITASHNPAKYNGIKFIPYYGGPATADITENIESNLENQKEVKCKDNILGFVEDINPYEDYKNHIRQIIDVDLIVNSNLKVLVNPMHGAAYGIFQDLLTDFGIKSTEMSGEPDPDFGFVTPEPIPRNLNSTIEKLKNEHYDMVLALDGDADRFGVFDAKGTFIEANYALSLIADYLVRIKKLKGVLVRSVATTHFIDLIAETNGIESIETPVGFKHVGQVMREKPVILGGEESAGLSILGHIPEKDGLLADLLLAEITAYYKKPLSEILADTFERYNKKYLAKRLDLELSNEAKINLMNKLKNSPPTDIKGFKVVKTIDIDGVKFILEDGSWLLARASGTEPIIRIYLETDSDKKLEDLQNYAKSLIE